MNDDGGLVESAKISVDVSSMFALRHAVVSAPPISRPSRKLAGVLPMTKWSSVKGKASFSRSLKDTMNG